MLFLSALLTLVSSFVAAQDAYKWKDSEGRTVYGSKPPKSGEHVESFTTRKLSTYSENKVLRAMGKEPKTKGAEKSPEFNIDAAKNKGAKSISKQEQKKRAQVTEVLLKSDLPRIEKNPEGLITLCAVMVQNPTEFHAFEISVAFEFPDGALIPAVGPFELEPQSQAEFFIPNELLPLDKKLGTDHGDVPDSEKKSNIALPKVILHSLGSSL